MNITVGIVEDDPMTLHQYDQRFSLYDDIEITMKAPNGKECLQKLALIDEKLFPRVILMDIEMPIMDGIEATMQVKETWPDVEIMMVTVFKDEEKIFESIRAGASGYLLKDSETGFFVQSIRDLVSGGVPLSGSIARKVLDYMRFNDKLPGSRETFNLSDRELEILREIVKDLSIEAISDQLFVSPHTIRTHIKNIYKKLQVHSRAALIHKAHQNRLI